MAGRSVSEALDIDGVPFPGCTCIVRGTEPEKCLGLKGCSTLYVTAVLQGESESRILESRRKGCSSLELGFCAKAIVLGPAVLASALQWKGKILGVKV